MGPALVEPDHLYLGGFDLSGDMPQWGRLSSSRITSRVARIASGRMRPQWGRLSSSRITRLDRLPESLDIGRNGAGSRRAGSPGGADRRAEDAAAAMGPALVEPDHPLGHRPVTTEHKAAMGPALVEPDHTPRSGCTTRRTRRCRNGAGSRRAGSPSVGFDPSGADHCRNGAGSRRAGITITWWAGLVAYAVPQWGRLSSSRITSRRPR